jgi:hypothetical protein
MVVRRCGDGRVWRAAALVKIWRHGAWSAAVVTFWSGCHGCVSECCIVGVQCGFGWSRGKPSPTSSRWNNDDAFDVTPLCWGCHFWATTDCIRSLGENSFQMLDDRWQSFWCRVFLGGMASRDLARLVALLVHCLRWLWLGLTTSSCGKQNECCQTHAVARAWIRAP